MSGTSIVDIGTGNILIVNGNVNMTGNASMQIAGHFRINGNLNMDGSTSVCGSGIGNVSRTITGS
ncbi:MAG: hypothetical protein DWQ48_11090 [Bacteroidetes bacterium]|nr:MAG: hypothetical protein DWQ48_11090 [Bacteroidota bacterium]